VVLRLLPNRWTRDSLCRIAGGTRRVSRELFRRAHGWDTWRDRGNGNIDPATGQSSESGRYQGYATSGIPRAVQAAGTVRSQGGDLYGMGGSLILEPAEYTAGYNLGKLGDVLYGPKFYRCESILINAPWAEIFNIPRGIGAASGKLTEPIWDFIYEVLLVGCKRGLPAPWTTQAKKTYDATAGGGEGHRIINDQPSKGYLIWSYDGPGLYRNNDERTIWGGGILRSDGLGNQMSECLFTLEHMHANLLFIGT
jgi:hypothetical protein